MRTVTPGTLAATAPEVLCVAAGEFDRRAVARADTVAQRLRPTAPLRFGIDLATDAAALRLLTESISRQVTVEWELAGALPWPIRTVVHLPPPSGAADAIARTYADQWRELHRFGLCMYRRGPGFVRIRDLRPGGRHQRVVADGPWAATFESLAAGTADATTGPAQRLLGELVDAGLAIRLGDGYHVLPFRPRRWPVPYLND